MRKLAVGGPSNTQDEKTAIYEVSDSEDEDEDGEGRCAARVVIAGRERSSAPCLIAIVAVAQGSDWVVQGPGDHRCHLRRPEEELCLQGHPGEPAARGAGGAGMVHATCMHGGMLNSPSGMACPLGKASCALFCSCI